MPKWLTAVIGAAETAVGAALMATGVGAPFGAMLLSAGIGTTLTGLGTLLAKGPITGTSTATKNPIKAWDIIYGRAAVGGTPIYIGSFGDSDKYLDMVFALAGHPCQDVYGLLFDRQRIQLDTTAVPTGVPTSSFPAINGGTSFTPVQQTVSLGTISRVNNVVTVSLGTDIPLLMAGDYVIISDVTGDKTLNGKFQVAQILYQTYVPGSPGNISFTYLCGGPEVTYSGQGQVKTTWPDYGRKVYMETLLGTQTLGQTFIGMTLGTPNDGNVSDLITNGPSNNANPWTRYCSGVGKTLVFLRLHYNDSYFANGLPQISFLVHGKNNIADPRFSPPAVGYSENAALCIADMLCEQTWGYKCTLGVDVPTAPLIVAANICDEPVVLAAPVASPPVTENRYLINGKFDLTMKRGEILQNMLTACGGRITYENAQFTIWPAAWWPSLAINAPGFTGQGIVTVNHLQVAGGDLTNFPMLINGTYPYLKTAANGGQVTNTSGYDITFSSDQQGTTPLQWEIEKWNPTTGELVAWVNVLRLSSLYDTVFYLNYGNAAITTQQNTPTAVWDAGYQAVLHLAGAGGSLSAADSTANGNNGVVTGATLGSSGISGGDAQFGGNGSGTNVTIPHKVYSETIGSLEFWPENYSDPYQSATGNLASGVYSPTIYNPGIGICQIGWRFGSINRDNGANFPLPGVGFPRWGQIAMTWDSTGNINVYAYGELIDSFAWSNPGTFPNSVVIGKAATGSGLRDYGGAVDEFRISSVVRSAGWIKTSWNNGISPQTFYSISSPGNMTIEPVGLWGPFRWRSTCSIRDLFNGVKGTYVSPGNNWQSSDFPPYCQDTLHGYSGPFTYEGDTNLAYDLGDRRWLDIQLPFTISAATAQRLAKIELLRRRNSGGNGVGTGTFTLSMAGYQQTALDIITMTVPFLSWTNKLLEIEAHRFKFDKVSGGNGDDVISLGTEIDVQETAETTYAWSPTEELSPQGYRQSALPSTASPASPTGVTGSSGIPTTILGADGINRSSILVSWTAPVDGFVTNGGSIEAQYQLATSPPGPWIALPSVSPSVTQISIPDVQDGSQYNVQIRSVNAAGVPSTWVFTGPVLVTALPTVLIEINGGSGYDILTVNLGDVFDAFEVNGA